MIKKTKKALLQAEIAKLQKQLAILELEEMKPVAINIPVKPKSPIYAADDLAEGQLCLVDRDENLVYPYPETPIIPGKRKVRGYASREYKTGALVSLIDWWKR